MKAVWSSAVARIAVCALFLSGASAKAQDFPVVTKTLKNGMRILVQPDSQYSQRGHVHLLQNRLPQRAPRYHRNLSFLRTHDV